jgi:outer membrane protein
LKNPSLILNLVLLAAVAYLFIDKFNSKEVEEASQVEVTADDAGSTEQASIVFINSDSLLDNYNYFNELEAVLESKQDSIDRLLQRRADNLEREFMEYQQKGATMTDMQRMETEQKLFEKQERILKLKDDLFEYLQTEEQRMNDSIHFHLTAYLKELNAERNYAFILGYQRGSGILLANDSLDITGMVIEGINSKGQ